MKELPSERCGNKHCAWVYTTTTEYFVSYRTITAFRPRGSVTTYATRHKYSPTTTKQMTQCIHDKVWIEEGMFSHLLYNQLTLDGLAEGDITVSAKTGW